MLANLIFSFHKEANESIGEDATNDTGSVTAESKKLPKKKKLKAKKVLNNADDSKPSTKDLAISYLKTWKKNRDKWSFKKSRQIWLIKNLYNPDTVNKKYFSYLLEYLEEAKGGVRARLLDNAQVICNSEEDVVDSEKLEKCRRAKMLMQMLSE